MSSSTAKDIASVSTPSASTFNSMDHHHHSGSITDGGNGGGSGASARSNPTLRRGVMTIPQGPKLRMVTEESGRTVFSSYLPPNKSRLDSTRQGKP